MVDNWYPGDAKKDKGVLLVVTAGKEGAVIGGEGFNAVRQGRQGGSSSSSFVGGGGAWAPGMHQLEAAQGQYRAAVAWQHALRGGSSSDAVPGASRVLLLPALLPPLYRRRCAARLWVMI